jgi:hypothetical protein
MHEAHVAILSCQKSSKIKTPNMTRRALQLTLLSFLFLASETLPAQSAHSVQEKSNSDFHRIIPLQDGTGRNLILERVEPQPLPIPQVTIPPTFVDPVVRAARRAAWAVEAKKERRMLSLTGIYYPNGLTLLQWFTRGPDGVWESYEAWSLTDFQSAWLMQRLEVNATIYDIFVTVSPAPRWDQRRQFPGPLYFPEGSPAFRLIKGDPTNAKAIEAITALHEIYRLEGAALTAQWLSLKATQAAEAAYLKANPPPVVDITVHFWPGKNVDLQSPTPPRTGYRRRP